MTKQEYNAETAIMKESYDRPKCDVYVTEAEGMICSSDPQASINGYEDGGTYTETLSLF